jgi:hypothetical protein
MPAIEPMLGNITEGGPSQVGFSWADENELVGKDDFLEYPCPFPVLMLQKVGHSRPRIVKVVVGEVRSSVKTKLWIIL